MGIKNLRAIALSAMVFVGISIVGLVAWIFAPKTVTLPVNDRWTASYTGLGILDTNGPLGYQYREFFVDDTPYRTWVVQNEGKPYNRVTGYYPNGKVCVEGTCMIHGTGFDMYALPDDVGRATCYGLEGEVIAEVVDGTGNVILLYPTGEKQWEMTYRDYVRTSYGYWYQNGELKFSSEESIK